MYICSVYIGTQEQSYIGNLMMYATCLGENTELCDDIPMTTVDPIVDYSGQTTPIAAPSLTMGLLIISWIFCA